MSGPSVMMETLGQGLSEAGLFMRGHLVFAEPEVAPLLSSGERAVAILLVGPLGGSLWPAFSKWCHMQADGGGADPLDAWSRNVVGALATAIGATAYFPFETPYQPFQRWAMQAEGLAASPLGLLIHPVYGLWHSYRAALGFDASLWSDIEPAFQAMARIGDPEHNICDACEGKPCLLACPVGAITETQFSVTTCRTYLSELEKGAGCMGEGCLARNACPVGQAHRQPNEQLRFHMAALSLPPRADITPPDAG